MTRAEHMRQKVDRMKQELEEEKARVRAGLETEAARAFFDEMDRSFKELEQRLASQWGEWRTFGAD